LFDGELAGPRVVDLCADDVGGQQVGRELDALEGELQAVSQRADGERFGEAGDALEQDVAASEQADEEPVDHDALADDDTGDFAVKRLQQGPHFAHLAVEFVGGHVNLTRTTCFFPERTISPSVTGKLAVASVTLTRSGPVLTLPPSTRR